MLRSVRQYGVKAATSSGSKEIASAAALRIPDFCNKICQLQTFHWSADICEPAARLLDHFGAAHEEHFGDREAKRLGSRQIAVAHENKIVISWRPPARYSPGIVFCRTSVGRTGLR